MVDEPLRAHREEKADLVNQVVAYDLEVARPFAALRAGIEPAREDDAPREALRRAGRLACTFTWQVMQAGSLRYGERAGEDLLREPDDPACGQDTRD